MTGVLYRVRAGWKVGNHIKWSKDGQRKLENSNVVAYGRQEKRPNGKALDSEWWFN